MKTAITPFSFVRSQVSVLLLAVLAMLLGPKLQAQTTLLSWDFAGATGSEATATAGIIDAGLGAGSGILSRGAGLTAAGNADRFNATGWALTNIANAVTGNDYFEFSLVYDGSNLITIDSLSFNWQRSASGTRELALRSSLDTYGANLSTFTVLDNTNVQTFSLNLAAATFADLSQSVTFRLYGWAEDTGGTGGFEGTGDDLVVSGSTGGLGGGTLFWDGSSGWASSSPGGGGAGTWNNDSGNWDAASTAVFSGAAGEVTVATVSADAGVQFSTTGYTLGSGTITLGGASAAANTITTDTGVTATINSVLSGSAGMTKAGAGTLTLGGANNYTGATTISTGALRASNNTALGTVAGGVTVANGAALELLGGITIGAEALNLSGTGINSAGALRNISGNNTYDGTITNTAAARINSDAGTLTLSGAINATNRALTFGGAGDIAVSGAITNSTSTLTKDGAGTLTLSGANAYTGATTISAGALRASNNTALGTVAGGVTVANGAALELLGGITIGAEALNLSGTGISSGGALRNISGNNTYGGTITNTAAARINSDADTLTLSGAINATNQDLTFGGAGNIAVSGAITNSTSTLTKDGAGMLTLSGANTYSGGTLVSGGRLIGTTTSLQGSITNDAAATFDQTTDGTYAGAMTGSGSLVKSGAGVVTLSGANSYSGGTLVSAGGLAGTTTSLQGSITNNAAVTFNQATDGTYAGTMSGTGSLNKTGSGEVTLSGNSSFEGGLSIDGGAVFAANNNALGTGEVTLNSGSLLATDNTTIGNDLVISGPVYGGFIISEYVEGSSNNKYIELYNGTGVDITLGDFRVALFANGAGAGSPTSIQDLSLVGAGAMLAHGQTLILRNSGAALTLPAGVTSYNSTVANFSGDDALALQSSNGSVNYDIFGVIGNDPGTAWTAGSLSTLDQTLTRDSDVLFGVTVNPSGTGASAFTTLGTEWTGAPIDTVSNLGSHTMNFQTGGGTIGSDIASASVTYSGSVTLVGAAVLTAATGGNTTFSGIVSGAGTLNKTGIGTVTLSGASANTFSGTTTVSAGTLQLNKTADTVAIAGDIEMNDGAFLLLSSSGNVADAAEITLSGGTITRGSGVSEVFGNLNIAGGSILDFGTGTVGDLQFQNYSYTGSSLVAVQNFLPGNRLQFLGASFSAGDLADFNFGSFAFTSGLQGDYFTITAIPEPSTYLAAAGLLGLMLWPSRKRIIRDTKKILCLTLPMRARFAARLEQKMKLKA